MSAMTGSAGVEIGGDTTAREFGLKCTKKASVDDIDRFKHTRLNIIDEVGFANQKDIESLSKKLREYTECYEQIYGSIAIVFIGDFCQLPTIGGKKIYESAQSIHWEQALNQLVELEGHHRYAMDPQLGTAMAAARNGNEHELRKLMKTREIIPNKLDIPPGIEARYATFSNKKRASINANLFRHYLQTYHHTDEQMQIPRGSLIIRGGALWGHSGTKLGHAAQKVLWETCSDAHIKHDKTKLADPFLTLFHGCELMINENIDVKNGIANGTCCQFVKAVLNHGEEVEKIKVHHRWVNSVDINNVDHIILRFDKSYHPKFQGTFKLRPRDKTCIVQYPSDPELLGTTRQNVKMKLTMFPVIGNFATTGHKLQGKTMENLVIAEWNKTENWAYVVLSRVRTLETIFLIEALSNDFSFSPAPEYLAMMDRLRKTILANTLENQENTTIAHYRSATE